MYATQQYRNTNNVTFVVPTCTAGAKAFICSLQHVEGTGSQDSPHK